MMSEKRLPIGIQTFSEIIRENYVYIDKTELIHRLIQSGKYYFLSRPRRFGKSLLVSTLKELFSGNRELFKGLWIDEKINWLEFAYPVIHIDFSGKLYEGKKELIDTIDYLIEENARKHKILLNQKTFDKKFMELVQRLAVKNRVVILIDEYDKPIIDFIQKREIAAENREILKNFYSAVKAADEYLKFVFLTGVSKFSKVSVFSGLNNLTDITLDDRYAVIAGYTQAELEFYFQDHLKMLPQSISLSMIKDWYNGYSWDGQQFVYNPYSILNLFDQLKVENYWFTSGTPTFLMDIIRENRSNIMDFEEITVSREIFDNFDVEHIETESILFQTGYLTIKKIFQKDGMKRYILSYPNQEVKHSFVNYLMNYFSGQSFFAMTTFRDNISDLLNKGNIEETIEKFKNLYASIPYDLSKSMGEGYYQTIFYLTLKLFGTSIQCEIETNQGRIDAVIETKNHIYITEFKLGKAADAMNQIRQKKYYENYRLLNKPIFLVGIGFSKQSRNIADYQIEKLPSS
jgi:hypothetical protein